MKTIKNFNLKNKTVLLRADLNSDVKNGRVLMSERIKESAKTINYLKKKKAKIVILAHQSRPGKSDFLSLKQHAEFLNNYTKIKFVNDIIGEKAEKEIRNLKQGEAILLENVRMLLDEFHPDNSNNKLLKLTKLTDVYVNDAFSVCHREQTSILLGNYFKYKCAGLLLEKEVNALKKIKLKNCLYILGGAKPEDNLKLLGKNKILACGLFGQMCLISEGYDLGAQNKYLKKQIRNYETVLRKLKRKLKNVVTPVDFAVKINNKRVEKDLSEFPLNYEIFDIGKKTQKMFVKEIKKAKAIYMKGPAGDFNIRKFGKGTYVLLRAVAKSRSYSVIGGGHLSDAVKKSKIPKNKFNQISLSGGALLSYIAGEKLPGLEALK